MKVVTLKKPKQPNTVNLHLNPVAHYRLMVIVAKRKALGATTTTASDVVNEVLLEKLAPVANEATVLADYKPRRRAGRPKKDVSQESQPA